MHGEYKTPGGKLAVADLDLVDGTLRNVQVSGDFFLYPDDLLEPIVAALEGLPGCASDDEIAAAVRHAIPADAVMLGTSPEGIAIAVRRALQAGAGGDEAR